MAKALLCITCYLNFAGYDITGVIGSLWSAGSLCAMLCALRAGGNRGFEKRVAELLVVDMVLVWSLR